MAAKNKEYWARRVKKMQDAIKDGAYKDARVIEREYDAAIREIDTKIRAWYQRIAVNNEISYADAVKLLKKDELEEFHWTVQQYIEHGSGVVSGDWAKQLENASARVHISRLDAMKFDLQAHAEELTGKRIGVTKNAAELAYTEAITIPPMRCRSSPASAFRCSALTPGSWKRYCRARGRQTARPSLPAAGRIKTSWSI